MQKVFLKSLAEILTGYTFRGAIEEGESGNIFVLQGKNISSFGEIEGKMSQTFLPQKLRTSAFVEKNDILLSARGIFRSAVWKEKKESILASSSLFILRLREKKVLPEYLALYLNSFKGQQELQKITSGSSIATLSRKELQEISIPIPSLEAQQKILGFMENWKKRKTLLEKKLSLHQGIADGVLSHFFSSL